MKSSELENEYVKNATSENLKSHTIQEFLQ